LGNSQNSHVVEIHGCLVCAKLFNMLVVYSPDGKLVDCVVTSHGGRRVADKNRALVACEKHSSSEVKSAYQRWLSLFADGTEIQP